MTMMDLPDSRITQDYTAEGTQYTTLQFTPDAQPAYIIGQMHDRGFQVCSVDFDQHEILFTREA